MKKTAGYFIVAMMGLLATVSGCGADLTEKDLSELHFVKAERMIGEKTPEERALSIKNKLAQMEEIIGTAVVVEGHTAIIGLRLESSVEQNRLAAVKQEAEDAAKAADDYLETVSVTTNTYIVSLIEEMERSRANGSGKL